ncbi:MAG: glycoside hydrolase family 104 protein [Elusimicrobiales bacterium]
MARIIIFSLVLIASGLLPLRASAQALDELLRYGGSETASLPELALPAPSADGIEAEPEQYLPPNNNEPGFEWETFSKSDGGPVEHFIYIGAEASFLKATPDQASGTGCGLTPRTRYAAAALPGFEGEHMTVQLAAPLPGCSLTGGYVYMAHISSSSAGGAWELPRTVHAFLDTLAYAEGTKANYNYIFTFATFDSYNDHPRTKKCAGKLCSTAAGRYQFLTKTWDPLASALGLGDFTPPNQEKATLEIIRRAGAYNRVLRSNVYDNFTSALSKLNTTWASLPGSPYGQPTHSTAELWRVYRAALAKY